jgi:hypothetical protein
MKIGFLFNHDQVHQVRHSLPIAIELARRSEVGEVLVLTGGPHLTAEVEGLLTGAEPRLKVRELSLRSASAKVLKRSLNWLIPAAKLALYRDNLDVFRHLDLLVVAEKTSAILKTRYGLPIELIHTRHGAGDRAIGFNAASRNFDGVFVAGEAIRDRLIRDAGVLPDQITVVGYPKFDVMPPSPKRPIFDNGRPTVLYNPHVAPHLSSWYRDGRAVLEFFAQSEEYNLIFAPHVMLFHRPVTVTIDPPRIHMRGSIPKSVLRAPNIHIDLSSPACTDMTYTRAADIYLGDASSQVYEFLLRPRPCIFIDSHETVYQGDPSYAHWSAGRVIRDVSELGDALREAVRFPDRSAPVQKQLFASHIDLTEEHSSVRAARAIEAIAGGRFNAGIIS